MKISRHPLRATLRAALALSTLILAFLGLGQVTAAGAGPDEGAQLANQVRDVFSAKCLDCHGPELKRPKGKFGYVLDLGRMAADPKLVVPGKPEESEIYRLIRDDEMPGDDAKVPPLTPAEKESVRRWIAVGAPAGASPAVVQISTRPDRRAEAAPQLPFWKMLLRWFGRFHPASTHIPVGLLLAAVVAEMLVWLSKRPSWMATVKFLVILGALGAVNTAILGWFNAAFSSYGTGSTADILLWHRWVGTVTALWALVCSGLLLTSNCEEGSAERTRFRAALFIGALLVSASGFLGSALNYGLDHYRWN
jgi:uncharacterized membrane protein/mono/diheme cytochrome c family protein